MDRHHSGKVLPYTEATVCNGMWRTYRDAAKRYRFFWNARKIKLHWSKCTCVVDTAPCFDRPFVFSCSGNRFVKVKCTLVQALRLCTGRTAHKGSRGIALLFHDHGARRAWGVSVTPRPLYPRDKTRYPLYRRLGGPQGRSGQVRKISPPPGFDPRTVQPVASRYNDYATRPTNSWSDGIKFLSKQILIIVTWLIFGSLCHERVSYYWGNENNPGAYFKRCLELFFLILWPWSVRSGGLANFWVGNYSNWI